MSNVVPKETIYKILEAGVQAPSGSNSQPWKFRVSGGKISVWMLPERDHRILNFKNRGTLVASGALIENIVIAASHFGLTSSINLLPDENKVNLVARISLRGGNTNPDPLFGSIWKRATNRKPYELKKLTKEQKRKLLAVAGAIKVNNVYLAFVDGADDIKALGRAASANEVVMFENKELHSLLFQEIVWTENEEKEKKSGLYLKTMELKPPQQISLKFVMRHWPVMKVLNAIGVAKGIAKGNEAGYSAASLYGGVLCGENDVDFINAGRVVERVWLAATSMGLSFHLITGVNFLWQRISAGDNSIFSGKHKELIDKSYKNIASIFGAGSKLVAANFRVGYGGEPSARSSRRAPEIIFS